KRSIVFFLPLRAFSMTEMPYLCWAFLYTSTGVNSYYYFELIDRLARGSVQQRLNQETLKDLIVPIIDYNEQNKIADIIEESFRHRKQSDTLLEVAKRAVEIAIEQDEDTAISFINNHISKIE
ncbi:restriction endonuclease subunit S, partial [Geobacillus stearothermophilus]|uniref:restriction endonuclease subunit S n=1 Tax=Geobacillus stearothermophilus TaxID=1422 RepID=UPI002E226214